MSGLKLWMVGFKNLTSKQKERVAENNAKHKKPRSCLKVRDIQIGSHIEQ